MKIFLIFIFIKEILSQKDLSNENSNIHKNIDKSSYFRVKLKRIKFELYTEPDLDQTWPGP